MGRNILLIILLLVLSAPIAAYVFQFGTGFWQDPSEWSDLGGYIGGIYTPILTVLTLSVLCVQIYLQMLQHRQHLVSLQEAQLTEYLSELNTELDKSVGENLTLRNYLIESYNALNEKSLKDMHLSFADELNQSYHKLYSMWSGAMACLEYIKTCSNIKSLGSTHYLVQKNKVIAYMGPQVCSSLDKHNFAMQLILSKITNSKLVQHIDYEFWVDKSQP